MKITLYNVEKCELGGAFYESNRYCDSIILKKYEPTCIFCGGLDGILTYKQRNICKSCIDKLAIVKENARLLDE